MENGHFALLSIKGLGGNVRYDVHLKLTGKCIVDFLLVLIELFLLGVMAKALRANIDRKSAFSLQWGQFNPKFQAGFVLYQPYFLS